MRFFIIGLALLTNCFAYAQTIKNTNAKHSAAVEKIFSDMRQKDENEINKIVQESLAEATKNLDSKVYAETLKTNDIPKIKTYLKNLELGMLERFRVAYAKRAGISPNMLDSERQNEFVTRAIDAYTSVSEIPESLDFLINRISFVIKPKVAEIENNTNLKKVMKELHELSRKLENGETDNLSTNSSGAYNIEKRIKLLEAQNKKSTCSSISDWKNCKVNYIFIGAQLILMLIGLFIGFKK